MWVAALSLKHCWRRWLSLPMKGQPLSDWRRLGYICNENTSEKACCPPPLSLAPLWSSGKNHLVASIPWWAECPRSTTHSLNVFCYTSILPSRITILFPPCTTPLITDKLFHTNRYGPMPESLLLVPFLIASFKSLYTLSPLTACLNHVHRGGGRSAMMTLRNLDVLSVIHHEVLPLQAVTFL